MGAFVDANSVSWTNVRLNVDPAALAGLSCSKTPDLFVRHLVERTAMIMGAVIYGGSQAAGSTAGVVQLSLRLSEPGDVAAMRTGMPLAWADCSTTFIDVTPASATLTVYLRLTVSPAGTATPAAVGVPASLLV